MASSASIDRAAMIRQYIRRRRFQQMLKVYRGRTAARAHDPIGFLLLCGASPSEASRAINDESGRA